MDYVSCDGRDIRVIENQGSDFERWASSLRIKLHSNSLEVNFVRRQESTFQLIEMLIGPFNFYPNQSESVVGGHDNV